MEYAVSIWINEWLFDFVDDPINASIWGVLRLPENKLFHQKLDNKTKDIINKIMLLRNGFLFV